MGVDDVLIKRDNKVNEHFVEGFQPLHTHRPLLYFVPALTVFLQLRELTELTALLCFPVWMG